MLTEVSYPRNDPMVRPGLKQTTTLHVDMNPSNIHFLQGEGIFIDKGTR